MPSKRATATVSVPVPALTRFSAPPRSAGENSPSPPFEPSVSVAAVSELFVSVPAPDTPRNEAGLPAKSKYAPSSILSALPAGVKYRIWFFATLDGVASSMPPALITVSPV